MIPLHRVKVVATLALAARFEGPGAARKSPPKSREMRTVLPPSRLQGRELDVLGQVGGFKVARRALRRGKLRLFRVFKLFDAIKSEEARTAFRPIGERLERQRWMRRL